jgi:hypothetical protein
MPGRLLRTQRPSAQRARQTAVHPANHARKAVSASGHVAHEGKSYHVGEAFADKSVGLYLNAAGKTELHFANVHLGNLTSRYLRRRGRTIPACGLHRLAKLKPHRTTPKRGCRETTLKAVRKFRGGE